MALANNVGIGSHQLPFKGGETEDYVVEFQEAGSTQTFKKGELVKLSSGQVAALTTPGTAALLDTDDTISGGLGLLVGFALKDATGTQGSTIPVHVIKASHQYLIPVGDADQAAAARSTLLAGEQAPMNVTYWTDPTWGTAKQPRYAVDGSSTTKPIVQCVAQVTEADESGSASETGVKAWVQFMPASLAYPD